MAQNFADDYIDVAARIVEFREKYPEGSLQPVNLAEPYRIEKIGELTFIVYAAAAFRSPTDRKPGVGLAWEPVPGKTNFTRNSELQNAETSAWGRAIVAALAADTKKSVASADEVRNRQAERDQPTGNGGNGSGGPRRISTPNAEALIETIRAAGLDAAVVIKEGTEGRTEDPADVLTTEISAVRRAIEKAKEAIS